MDGVNLGMLSQEKPYRKNRSKVQSIVNEHEAKTIYVGAKSSNNNAKLRIYDKKDEVLNGRQAKG